MNKIILMPTSGSSEIAPDPCSSEYLDRLRSVCGAMELISKDFEYDLKDIIADTMYLAIGSDIAKTLN